MQRIQKNRIAHMHGVAEYMYENAEKYGCDKRKMYLLGLIHDIGYVNGMLHHEQLGAELIGEDTFYGKLIKAHELTPQEYMDTNKCNISEIPNELILLWTANMMVDFNGKTVGFKTKLEEVAKRYGANSKPYLKYKASVEWLEKNKQL